MKAFALDHNIPSPPRRKETVEEALGRTLPEDDKAFLRIHNGQVQDASFIEETYLMPLERVAEEHEGFILLNHPNAQTVDPAQANPEVQSVYYSNAWIPIACSSRGRDFLCLDFAPASAGQEGQIVLSVIDFGERKRIAGSFARLLSLYLEKLRAGGSGFEGAPYHCP